MAPKKQMASRLWSNAWPRRRLTSELVLSVGCALAIGLAGLPLYSTGSAHALEILAIVLAVGLGVALYAAAPVSYLVFVWVLWMLTPEVRRLVDYLAGWDPANPVVLAPYLVTGICLLDVLGCLRGDRERHLRGFILIFMGLFAGFAVGVVRNGISSASFSLLEWAVPPLLALHVIRRWKAYASYRRVVVRLAALTAAIVGGYGIYQFFYLPDWDRFWMLNAPLPSIGQAAPQRVRVFSTLNSPGPLAAVLVVVLLILVLDRQRFKWRPVSTLSGMAALGLSLVRIEWVAVAAGLLCIAFTRKLGSKRFQSLSVIALIIAVLITVAPIAGLLNDRLGTMAQLNGDLSAQQRVEFYRDVGLRSLADPIGHGLGSTGGATKLDNVGMSLGQYGNFDSGLIEIPFVLGWLGGALYVIGMFQLLMRTRAEAFPGRSHSIRNYELTYAPIMLAGGVALLSGNVLRDVSGVMLWLSLGLWVAASLIRNSGNLPNPDDMGSAVPNRVAQMNERSS